MSSIATRGMEGANKSGLMDASMMGIGYKASNLGWASTLQKMESLKKVYGSMVSSRHGKMTKKYTRAYKKVYRIPTSWTCWSGLKVTENA